MTRVDGDAVRAGALVGIAVCLPLAVLAQVLTGDDDTDRPPIILVLYVAVLIGFVLAGRTAAARTAESPFASGGVAAAVAFVAIQAVGIVSNAVRGDSIRVVNIVFNAMLAYGAGLLGAGMIVRRQPRA